jgi:hypothetical protein
MAIKLHYFISDRIISVYSNKIFSYVIDENMILYLSQINIQSEFITKHSQIINNIEKNIFCAGTFKWINNNTIYYTLDSPNYLAESIPHSKNNYISNLLYFIKIFFHLFKKRHNHKINFELFINPVYLNSDMSFKTIASKYIINQHTLSF